MKPGKLFCFYITLKARWNLPALMHVHINPVKHETTSCFIRKWSSFNRNGSDCYLYSGVQICISTFILSIASMLHDLSRRWTFPKHQPQPQDTVLHCLLLLLLYKIMPQHLPHTNNSILLSSVSSLMQGHSHQPSYSCMNHFYFDQTQFVSSNQNSQRYTKHR